MGVAILYWGYSVSKNFLEGGSGWWWGLKSGQGAAPSCYAHYYFVCDTLMLIWAILLFQKSRSKFIYPFQIIFWHKVKLIWASKKIFGINQNGFMPKKSFLAESKVVLSLKKVFLAESKMVSCQKKIIWHKVKWFYAIKKFFGIK